MPPQPFHRSCSDYLERLAEAGTELVFSQLLELELREAAFQIALKERHPRDWKRFRADGRARPRAVRLVDEVAVAWDAVLESFVWTEVDIADVIGDVSRLMAHGVASYDAVHAATAIAGGVDCLVTTDAGFAVIPEADLQLYVDGSRVRSCRDRRR